MGYGTTSASSAYLTLTAPYDDLSFNTLSRYSAGRRSDSILAVGCRPMLEITMSASMRPEASTPATLPSSTIIDSTGRSYSTFPPRRSSASR